MHGHRDQNLPRRRDLITGRVPVPRQQCSRPDTREPGLQVPQESAQATAKPVPTVCGDRVEDKDGGFTKAKAEQPGGLLSGVSHAAHREGKDRNVAGCSQAVATGVVPAVLAPRASGLP